MILVGLTILTNSCGKQSLELNPNESCAFELDQERVSIVYDFSEMFNQEFGVAIKNFKLNNDFFDPKDFSKYFIENFEKKLSDYQKKYSYSKTATQDNNNIDYQPYLDEVSERIENFNVDVEKEEALTLLTAIIDNYVEEVMFLPDVPNEDKQLIIEKILLHKGVFLTIISYGDELNEDNKNGNKCGWVCRNLKRIHCTSLTVFAAGVCGLTVVAILTQQYAAAFGAGTACAWSIYASIDCWNSI